MRRDRGPQLAEQGWCGRRDGGCGIPLADRTLAITTHSISLVCRSSGAFQTPVSRSVVTPPPSEPDTPRGDGRDRGSGRRTATNSLLHLVTLVPASSSRPPEPHRFLPSCSARLLFLSFRTVLGYADAALNRPSARSSEVWSAHIPPPCSTSSARAARARCRASLDPARQNTLERALLRATQGASRAAIDHVGRCERGCGIQMRTATSSAALHLSRQSRPHFPSTACSPPPSPSLRHPLVFTMQPILPWRCAHPFDR